MPVPATPGEDEHETLFGELQRQSGLTAPLQWESAVENYITLKNMAGLSNFKGHICVVTTLKQTFLCVVFAACYFPLSPVISCLK